MPQGPEVVAEWLGSMTSCIPIQVLNGLKTKVSRHQIDGHAFGQILDECRLHELGIDNLSPLHMTRLRKAWNTDFPKAWESGKPAPRSAESLHCGEQPQPCAPPPYASTNGRGGSCSSTSYPRDVPQAWAPAASFGFAPPKEMQNGNHVGGGPTGAGVAPHTVPIALVAVVVDRLAQWSGFDRSAALTELRTVLPPPVCDELSVVLRRRGSHAGNVQPGTGPAGSCRGAGGVGPPGHGDYGCGNSGGGHAAAPYMAGSHAGANGTAVRPPEMAPRAVHAGGDSERRSRAATGPDDIRGHVFDHRTSLDDFRGGDCDPRSRAITWSGGQPVCCFGVSAAPGQSPSESWDPQRGHAGGFQSPQRAAPAFHLGSPVGNNGCNLGSPRLPESSPRPQAQGAWEGGGGTHGGGDAGGATAAAGFGETESPVNGGASRVHPGGGAAMTPQRGTSGRGSVSPLRRGTPDDSKPRSMSAMPRTSTSSGRGSFDGVGKAPAVQGRSPTEVASWARQLPASQVPDRERQALASAIEAEDIDGNRFTGVAGDPHALAARGLPSPQHAVKVRKAWDQVLREDACRQVALEATMAQKSPQKAVKMIF